MFETFTRTALAAATVIAAAGFSASAQAAPLEGASTTVGFADLDLASASDATRLEARVRRAAERVCGGANLPRDLSARAEMLACRQVALDAARPHYEMQVAAARSETIDYASAGREKIGR